MIFDVVNDTSILVRLRRFMCGLQQFYRKERQAVKTEHIDFILSEVRGTVAEVQDAQDEVEAARDYLVGVKESAAGMGAMLPDDVRNAQIAHYYWDRTDIDCKVIADLFGVTTNHLRLIAGPRPTGQTCECGEPLMVKSRSRRAALKRARWRCQACNEKTSLHVHHRTYKRRGCELNRDVIALCADCHGVFHENLEVAK